MSNRKFRLTEFKVTVIEEMTDNDGPNIDVTILKDQVKYVLPDNSHVETVRTYIKDMSPNEAAKEMISRNEDPKELDLNPITTWE